MSGARLSIAQKNFARAAIELESALDVCPRRSEILLELGRTHLLAQQIPEAKRALTELVALEPRNTTALKLQSDAYYLAGQDAEAETALVTATRLEPRNADVQYALGRVLYQQSRYAEALERFQAVVAIDAQSYKAWDNLGLCYEGMNEAAQATKAYLRAISIVHEKHSEYDWPYANLANLLIKQEQYRQAFDLAVEASQRNPDSARNFYLTGKALFKLGQVEKAVRWLEHSAVLDSEYPEPHYLLGQIYRKWDKPAESEREFKRFKILHDKAPRQLR